MLWTPYQKGSQLITANFCVDVNCLQRGIQKYLGKDEKSIAVFDGTVFVGQQIPKDKLPQNVEGIHFHFEETSNKANL